jgi:hypothetical protein
VGALAILATVIRVGFFSGRLSYFFLFFEPVFKKLDAEGKSYNSWKVE